MFSGPGVELSSDARRLRYIRDLGEAPFWDWHRMVPIVDVDWAGRANALGVPGGDCDGGEDIKELMQTVQELRFVRSVLATCTNVIMQDAATLHLCLADDFDHDDTIRHDLDPDHDMLSAYLMKRKGTSMDADDDDDDVTATETAVGLSRIRDTVARVVKALRRVARIALRRHDKLLLMLVDPHSLPCSAGATQASRAFLDAGARMTDVARETVDQWQYLRTRGEGVVAALSMIAAVDEPCMHFQGSTAATIPPCSHLLDSRKAPAYALMMAAAARNRKAEIPKPEHLAAWIGWVDGPGLSSAFSWMIDASCARSQTSQDLAFPVRHQDGFRLSGDGFLRNIIVAIRYLGSELWLKLAAHAARIAPTLVSGTFASATTALGKDQLYAVNIMLRWAHRFNNIDEALEIGERLPEFPIWLELLRSVPRDARATKGEGKDRLVTANGAQYGRTDVAPPAIEGSEQAKRRWNDLLDYAKEALYLHERLAVVPKHARHKSNTHIRGGLSAADEVFGSCAKAELASLGERGQYLSHKKEGVANQFTGHVLTQEEQNIVLGVFGKTAALAAAELAANGAGVRGKDNVARINAKNTTFRRLLAEAKAKGGEQMYGQLMSAMRNIPLFQTNNDPSSRDLRIADAIENLLSQGKRFKDILDDLERHNPARRSGSHARLCPSVRTVAHRRGVMPCEMDELKGDRIGSLDPVKGIPLLTNSCRAGAAFWLVRLGLVCLIIQQQWRATAPLREDLLAITHWFHDEVDASPKQEIQTRHHKTATAKIKHFVEWCVDESDVRGRQLLGTLLHSGIGYCYSTEMKRANLLLGSTLGNVIHSAINMARLAINFEEEDAIYEATMSTIIPWAQEKTIMMSIVDATTNTGANSARVQLPIGGIWARTPATAQTHTRLVAYATKALRDYHVGKTKAEAMYNVMRFVLLHGIVFRENYRGVRSPKTVVTPGTPLAWSVIVKSCPPPPEQTTGQPFAGATPVVMAAFAGLDNIVRTVDAADAQPAKNTVVAFGLSWLVCRAYERSRHSVIADSERGLPLDYVRCKIGIFSRHEGGWLTSVLPKLALGRVLGRPEKELPIKTAVYAVPSPTEIREYAERACVIEDIGRLAIDLHAKSGKFQIPVKLAAKLHAIATTTTTPLRRDDVVGRMIWWVSVLFGCFYRSDSLRRGDFNFGDKPGPNPETAVSPPKSAAAALNALRWTNFDIHRRKTTGQAVYTELLGTEEPKRPTFYETVAGLCALACGLYKLSAREQAARLFAMFTDEMGLPEEVAFWAHGLPVYPSLKSGCLVHLANEFGGVYGTMMFLSMFNDPEHRQEAMAVISHRLQYGIEEDEMGEQELDLVPHERHYRDVTNWYQIGMTIAQALALPSIDAKPDPSVIHDLTFIDDRRDVCPRPPPHQHVLSIWAADALLLALPASPESDMVLEINATTVHKIRTAMRSLLDPNFEMPVVLADGNTARIEGGASYFNPGYGFTCLRATRGSAEQGKVPDTSATRLRNLTSGESTNEGTEPVCEDFLTRLITALEAGMHDLGNRVYGRAVVALGVIFGLPCPPGVPYNQWLLSLCEMIGSEPRGFRVRLSFDTGDQADPSTIPTIEARVQDLVALEYAVVKKGTTQQRFGLLSKLTEQVFDKLLTLHDDDPKVTGLLSTFDALFPVSQLCNDFAWELVGRASRGLDSSAQALITDEQKSQNKIMKPGLQTALEKLLPFAPEPRIRRAA